MEITFTSNNTTKADVKVSFHPKKLDVKIKTENFTLQLYSFVTPDECTWQLSDGKLVVTLEKREEGQTWPALVES